MSENQTPKSGQEAGDPLASLHRMSTTAGAASQEYVAINLAAVATLVLGVASMAVLMGMVMLIIPAVAIIFGIVALRQISNSNGTQAGRIIAWLGMILAVSMAALVIGREARVAIANSREEQVIKTTVAELGSAIKAADYPKAWTFFAPSFQNRKDLNLTVFTNVWKAKLAENPYYGKITTFKTNDVVQVSAAAVDGSRQAVTMLVIRFDKTDQEFRREIFFRNLDGVWKVESLPTVFPPPAQEAPAAPNLPGKPLPM
jgi:hypothetical protein